MEERERRRSYTRDETKAQKLDRNFNELLQELRVAQAGVQILFAFLLSIAFQQRFASVDGFEKAVYLIALVFAAIAAILLIAPVAAHRMMFGQGVKDTLVMLTSFLAQAGLVSLALSMLAAVLLIVELVTNLVAGIVVTAALAALVVGAWYAAPINVLRRRKS